MTLAPGVTFDEGKHEYYYKGKRLSGVTGIIARHLGQTYSSEFVVEYQEEGLHVHRAVQDWINAGNAGSIHPGVTWVTDRLASRQGGGVLSSEVLVSDLARYASLVDIVEDMPPHDGRVNIYDIKAGLFKRDSVTWQLSIYKYLIDTYTTYRVNECVCISVRDREFYKIFPKSSDKVEKLLYAG